MDNIVASPSKNKRKTFLVLVAFTLFSFLVWFVLDLLGDNINYFKPPSLITLADRQTAKPLRLGGIVKIGSLHLKGSDIVFSLSDGTLSEKIYFNGVLPDLFREGQGVVVDGQFDKDGNFMAHRILAKHDENYRSTEGK